MSIQSSFIPFENLFNSLDGLKDLLSVRPNRVNNEMYRDPEFKINITDQPGQPFFCPPVQHMRWATGPNGIVYSHRWFVYQGLAVRHMPGNITECLNMLKVRVN